MLCEEPEALRRWAVNQGHTEGQGRQPGSMQGQSISYHENAQQQGHSSFTPARLPLKTNNFIGEGGGSAGKGPYCYLVNQEPRNLHSVRKEPSPLTSICA